MATHRRATMHGAVHAARMQGEVHAVMQALITWHWECDCIVIVCTIIMLSSGANAGLSTVHTFLRVLAKMTDWVIARVSYRSHRVSSFHSSFSTLT